MLVAIEIQIPCTRNLEASLGLTFGIQFFDFTAVASNCRNKGNMMSFCHFMRDWYKKQLLANGHNAEDVEKLIKAFTE